MGRHARVTRAFDRAARPLRRASVRRRHLARDETGRRVAIDARRELERDGVDTGTLQRCQAHGRDGTRLERCVKLYLPSTGGPWRMVFEITRDRASGELVLAYSRSASDTPASRGSYRPTKSRTNGFTPASRRPPIAKTRPRTVVLGHAQRVMAGRHGASPSADWRIHPGARIVRYRRPGPRPARWGPRTPNGVYVATVIEHRIAAG